MSYETEKAVKEASFEAAWQAWVDACPARNTSLAEGLFKAGFDRGWDKNEAIKQATVSLDAVAEGLLKAKDAEIAQLKRDVTHWQANHTNEVKRSRILKECPDMPITRVHAYEVWGEDLEEITRLRHKLAAAEASAQSVFLDYMARDTEATELAQQLYSLKKWKPSNPAATVRCVNGVYQVFWHQCPPDDGTQLYIGPVSDPEPKAAGTEVQLNIIRKWPEGFQERFFAVWADLAGMIPNVRLYDLQRVLAEFGFTMKIYEGAAPEYHDATPHLHVGDSAFESWYANYVSANKGDKQRARDAYAAGMGDPLVKSTSPNVPMFGVYPNGNDNEVYRELGSTTVHVDSGDPRGDQTVVDVDPAFASAHYQHDLKDPK